MESSVEGNHKKRNLIIGSVFIIACMAAVGLTVQKVHADHLNTAQIAYSSALNANKAGYEQLDSVLKFSDPITTWKSDSVMNGKVIDTVKIDHTSASNASSRKLYSSIKNDGSIDGLNQATEQLKKDSSSLASQSEDLTQAINTANVSKTDKTIKVAQDGLNATIASARKTLDQSNNKVANNATRSDLTNRINDASNKVKTKDVNSINDSKSALTASVKSVEQSEQDYAAQAAAAQQAAIQASARSSSGTSTRRTYTKTYTSNGKTYTRTYTSNGSYTSSADCTPNAADPVCQGAVDRGGLTHISYYGGSTNIYAQHNNTGGNRINSLTIGSTVTLNGRQYVVTSNNVNQTTAPSSGTYLQTCTGNGNGNRLVGLTAK
jgi:hypothetical protein